MTDRFARSAALGLLAATMLALPTLETAAQESRYVTASQLFLRAAAAPDGALLAVLEINTSVEIVREVDGTWCEIRAGDPPRTGYAACGFLGTAAVNATELRNALDASRRERDAGGEAALDMLERLFALEPSEEVVRDYAIRLMTMYGYSWWSFENPERAPAQVQPPEAARRTQSYLLMQRRLKRDALPALGAALAEAGGEWYSRGGPRWRAGRNDLRRGVEPTTRSLFETDGEIVAYGGGNLVGRMRTRSADGVPYFLEVDEAWENLPVLVSIATTVGGGTEAVSMPIVDSSPAGDGAVRATIVETRLPVYAVTPDGLLAGTLARVSDFGGACNQPRSGVDVLLERPSDEILAVFATTRTIDPAAATVMTAERNYKPTPGTDTHEVAFVVDLDGDGNADLRGGYNRDTESEPAAALVRVSLLRPAAGWYAYDETWVEANIDGGWKLIFFYSVSTCT